MDASGSGSDTGDTLLLRACVRELREHTLLRSVYPLDFVFLRLYDLATGRVRYGKDDREKSTRRGVVTNGLAYYWDCAARLSVTRIALGKEWLSSMDIFL